MQNRPALSRLTLALAAFLGLGTAPGFAYAVPVAAHWTLMPLVIAGEEAVRAGVKVNAGGQVIFSSKAIDGAVSTYLYSNGTFTNLGSLGGRYTQGSGINAAGQVSGTSRNSDGFNRAFLYSNGTMTDLGTLGGNESYGGGINSAGHVTGGSYFLGEGQVGAFVYRNGSMNGLAQGGWEFPFGSGINDAGQVIGSGYTPINSDYRAFIYSNGTTTDLGAFDRSGYSTGYAINASGQATGDASGGASSLTRAFLYSNGTMMDLGTLSGNRQSFGRDINTAGQVTGFSGSAFLYSNGNMINLNTLNGVAAGGLQLFEGSGINDAGQIVGLGEDASEVRQAFLLTLDTIVWEGGSAGSFSSGSGWSFQTAPNRNSAVFIDPTVSAVITGPTANIDVRQLTVGGGATGNNGIATLVLNGGTINVVGNAGQFTTITSKGVLRGDGTIHGAVFNAGTVNATNLTLGGGLVNTGTVTGDGRLNTSLSNSAGGLLRVDTGRQLMLAGTSHSNSGSVELRGGGELQVVGTFTNAAAGRVVLNNGIARFTSGLSNNGQVQVSFGGGEVFGVVTNHSGGKIILSGNSDTTFHDDVEVKNGSELRVSNGATVVFFGRVFQRTGSNFTGTGTSFYEGGLSIGSSPGYGNNAGNVSFGAGSDYLAEIGGTLACGAACGTDVALRNMSFDKYVVAGHLELGGTLRLVSWNGFTAQAGQRFDVLDWGSVSGSFAAIDASGFTLAAGTVLDTSQLYINGSINVAAIPEPHTWGLMLAGLLAVGHAARRQRRRH